MFSHKIRIRCCALIEDEGRLLLLNHRGLNADNEYWLPPGGGLEPHETPFECLKREVWEETNIQIEQADFYVLHEFISPPLHAVELFFQTSAKSNIFAMGIDPELPNNQQLIQEIRWFTAAEIGQLSPENVHPVVFSYIKKLPTNPSAHGN